MNQATTPPHDGFAVQYEQLRLRVVAGAGFGTQLGMAVLRREGVAAWMCRLLADQPEGRRAPLPPAMRGATTHPIGEIDSSMVRVLANMTLGSLGVAHV